MSIKPLLQKIAAIGLALLLFYCTALLGDHIKTAPQWVLGMLMLLWIMLHFMLPRKWARLLFYAWAAISTFFMLWSVGYALAMWQHRNCFTDESGTMRCVMPIFQLFIGFIFAAIGELFILWKLHHFSQPKWERIWQIAALTGLITGAVYRFF